MAVVAVLAFVDRAVVFFAAAALVVPHAALQPVFLVVVFALGERLALVFAAVVFAAVVFVAVVFLAVVFLVVAIYNGSSIVDVLFRFRLRR